MTDYEHKKQIAVDEIWRLREKRLRGEDPIPVKKYGNELLEYKRERRTEWLHSHKNKR